MTTTFQEEGIKNENFTENDKRAINYISTKYISNFTSGPHPQSGLVGRLPSRKIMNLFLSGRKNTQTCPGDQDQWKFLNPGPG